MTTARFRLARDGDDTSTMENLIAFLKDKLSSEDLAHIHEMFNGPAVGPHANSTEASVAAMRALQEAQSDTQPVLGAGARDMSLNSAAAVYRKALTTMGVEARGVLGAAPLQQIFRAHRDSR